MADNKRKKGYFAKRAQKKSIPQGREKQLATPRKREAWKTDKAAAREEAKKRAEARDKQAAERKIAPGPSLEKRQKIRKSMKPSAVDPAVWRPRGDKKGLTWTGREEYVTKAKADAKPKKKVVAKKKADTKKVVAKKKTTGKAGAGGTNKDPVILKSTGERYAESQRYLDALKKGRSPFPTKR